MASAWYNERTGIYITPTLGGCNCNIHYCYCTVISAK